MKKDPGVYTHSMETIFLSLTAQVAVGTFSRKIYCSLKGYTPIWNQFHETHGKSIPCTNNSATL